MNLGQRVVSSVALAGALAVGAFVAADQWRTPAAGGWFMYSPNADTTSSPLFSVDRGDEMWKTATVWLVALAIWFVASWRLFRTKR